ncbi:hypothetical protein, partial [Klebsiella pneumoniae]|uniref:hypothetical protein n=1 Tax=Klebsiella pneumoniae TaxID=573 RepID=UPI0019672CC5
TLTHEQAKEKLAELGVKLPEKGKREEMFANLDGATKEKAKAIMKKAKEQLASKVPLEEKWTMQELLLLEQALVQQKPQLTPEDLLSAVEHA